MPDLDSAMFIHARAHWIREISSAIKSEQQNAHASQVNDQAAWYSVLGEYATEEGRNEVAASFTRTTRPTQARPKLGSATRKICTHDTPCEQADACNKSKRQKLP